MSLSGVNVAFTSSYICFMSLSGVNVVFTLMRNDRAERVD